MNELSFSRWLLEGGQVVIPSRLLEKLQPLNISAENLGYLVLGLAKAQEQLPVKETAQNQWIKWCLAEGWAAWQGDGENRKITFAPLYKRLYHIWEEKQETEPAALKKGEFNYGKIVKWLDQVRGTISVTMREKQIIQELNLRFGWSTDFILIFLQLAFERGHNQAHAYYPLAKKLYENSIDTVEGLVKFMDNLDWTQFKVIEVKKCVGQYGGATRPQREMYLKWNKAWGFSHEVIMRAAEETVRTNNPSFKYIDAILADWHAQGITDLAGAGEALAAHDQKNRTQKKESNNTSRRVNQSGHRDLEKLLGIE